MTDGIFETTLDQLDIIAPNDILETMPEPPTNAVADGLNSGIYSVASTSSDTVIIIMNPVPLKNISFT